MYSNNCKEKLIIISIYAPDEIYLSKEIKFLKEKYSIVLFRKENKFYSNVRVKNEPDIEIVEIPMVKKYSLRFYAHLLLSLFRRETVQEFLFLLQQGKWSIRLLKKVLWEAVVSHADTAYIKKAISQNKEAFYKASIYTYRLDFGTLTAINLKNILDGKKCIGRAHGIDLYEYRDPADYLPFRKYIMENIDEIYTISMDGYNYLYERYPFANDKIQVARLGTNDYGVESFRSRETLSIVSCSRVEKIKRIDRIIKALAKINSINIKWTHIGDGSLLPGIKNLAECTLPPNIQTKFVGNLENSKIYEVYKKNYFDIFINVSYDEGLPVAIMEASSFGIPVIATDVGGTSEIVENGYNGWLIPRDYDDSILCDLLLAYHRMEDNDKQIVRENARCKWENGFNQEINYRKFVDTISVTESSKKTS